VASIFKVQEKAKDETSMKSLLATCFPAGLLLGLLFYTEEGGEVFLRNVG
jgi:hypothetical protein